MFVIKTEIFYSLFWVHKEGSPIKIFFQMHFDLQNQKQFDVTTESAGLIYPIDFFGGGIGNSHGALIKAPNTDSQIPINYSSRLDWQFPINGWLLSFSQVPCSQSVQTKQVAAEETSSSSP